MRGLLPGGRGRGLDWFLTNIMVIIMSGSAIPLLRNSTLINFITIETTGLRRNCPKDLMHDVKKMVLLKHLR